MCERAGRVHVLENGDGLAHGCLEGEEEEVQDFGIRSRQGLMLAVAFVMDRVTAMCQLPLRVAVECFAQQSGCGESRL